jgi:hypothetical protein
MCMVDDSVGAKRRARNPVRDAEPLCDSVHSRDLSRTGYARERKRWLDSVSGAGRPTGWLQNGWERLLLFPEHPSNAFGELHYMPCSKLIVGQHLLAPDPAKGASQVLRESYCSLGLVGRDGSRVPP